MIQTQLLRASLAMMLASSMACTATEEEPTPDMGQPDLSEEVDAPNSNNIADSPCSSVDLLSQCPVGSVPIVSSTSVAGCSGDGVQIQDDEGTVTGVCRTEESCSFVCNFLDPCKCGIAELTRDSIICAECTTACGNAACETGETPDNCPLDCGATCTPDSFRCNGKHREICEDNGTWTLLTCREDQDCIVALPNAESVLSKALCQTLITRGGGTFEGLGTWERGATTEHAGVRFPLLQFDFSPLRFVEDGRLLGKTRDSFVMANLDDLDDLQVEELPGGSFDLDERTAISDISLARRFEVEALADRSLQNMKDFGGIQEDLLKGRLTYFRDDKNALSKDGSLYALAFLVGFEVGELQATIVVWDSVTGDALHLLSYEDSGLSRFEAPRAMVFSHNNKTLIVSYGARVVIWDLDSGKYVTRLDTSDINPDTLLLDTSGKSRLILGQSRHFQVWDLDPLVNGGDPMLLQEQKQPNNVEGTLAIEALSTNGELLLLDSGDLLDLETLDVIRNLPGQGRSFFEPGRSRVVRGDALLVEEL